MRDWSLCPTFTLLIPFCKRKSWRLFLTLTICWWYPLYRTASLESHSTEFTPRSGCIQLDISSSDLVLAWSQSPLLLDCVDLHLSSPILALLHVNQPLVCQNSTSPFTMLMFCSHHLHFSHKKVDLDVQIALAGASLIWSSSPVVYSHLVSILWSSSRSVSSSLLILQDLSRVLVKRAWCNDQTD